VPKQIRGGKVTSINSLRSSVKKGGGSGSYLTRIPSDGSLTVRFLTEPTEWIAYFEYYDAEQKRFFPSVEGVQTQERPAARYLANALDVAESRVVPLVMPKSVAASLLKKYDKYATLLDRDYELSRSGAGLDTEYDVTPEPPTKMNLERYDLLDLMGLLESQLEDVPVNSDDDDEDEEDEKPVARKSIKSTPKSKVDDDEDEDEDDDSDSDAEYSRDDLEEKSLAELKVIARELGHTTKGLDSDDLINLILGDAEDDDEDDEVLATGSSSDDDEDDESEEDDSDSEDGEYETVVLDEDELRKMSMKEIKEIAADYELKVKAGASKDDIIEMILDVASVDEEDEEEAPF
jgi:hypothetical protein